MSKIQKKCIVSGCDKLGAKATAKGRDGTKSYPYFMSKCWRHKSKLKPYDPKQNSNPKNIYWQTKGSANRRGIQFSIGKQEFFEWWSAAGFKCSYCDRTIQEINSADKTFARIGRMCIDRKDNSFGYISGNLLACCYRCNAIKSDYFSFEEMLKIGEIIKSRNR